MSRKLAALAALTLISGAARAADEVDPKTQAAIQAAVDKAVGKAEEQLRADIQTSQASKEIDAAVAPGPKLQFIELDGYFRLRGDMYDDLDLDSGTDASGRYLFPIPLRGDPKRGTLAGANMRLRLEPTLNVSEQVRVRGQVDVFDNYAFGSSNSALFDASGSPYPVPLYGSSRSFLTDATHTDRAAILVKRAWAEVQTPVGLLSFGRMPAGWGLGILQNPGSGLDDDYGDTVDRIQFALPPVTTPVGPLTVVPSLDFDSEGAQRFDARIGGGAPLDADNADDARSWGLKLARLDTDDELRRKLEKGEGSLNYGAFYQYKAQVWTFPSWVANGTLVDATGAVVAEKRNAYANVLDLWARWQKGPMKVELEAAGIYGHIGNANAANVAPAATSPSGEILIRQLGFAINGDYALMPNKLRLGGQAGFASGDDAPGFGNDPNVGPAPAATATYPYGVLEGAQYGDFAGRGDHSIRNFRFNPAYRVDVILFRQILGGVTDAWYVKPTVHWDVVPGIAADGAIVYSSALFGESTPSSTGPGTGKKALGIEGDAKVTYTSGDGFQAWVEYGILQPLDGLKTSSGVTLARGHALHVGLAAKF